MWADFHLTPIPLDAPPFVVSGQPHVPMRVVAYSDQHTSFTELDERWAIECTAAEVSDGLDYAAGDLIVFTER